MSVELAEFALGNVTAVVHVDHLKVSLGFASAFEIVSESLHGLLPFSLAQVTAVISVVLSEHPRSFSHSLLKLRGHALRRMEFLASVVAASPLVLRASV